MNIYYINNHGQTIDLMKWPFKISSSDLFDYGWKYENRSNLNPKITRFYRGVVEKKVKVGISARNLEIYNQAMMNLLEVTERDVLNMTPGRLYVDDTYLSCYFMSSKKADWSPGVAFLTNTFTIASESGKWIREIKSSYATGGQPAETETYMDFAYDYAYDYSSSSGWAVFENPGYAPADFELTIHGPCENPEVLIAGHSYLVNCELLTGEYLKINSITRKIYKVCVNGEQVNQFALRSRDSYVFEKIPVGDSVVAWDGSFSFDLLLYEERSEPRWT